MSLVQIHASGRVEVKDKEPKLVKKVVSRARRNIVSLRIGLRPAGLPVVRFEK